MVVLDELDSSNVQQEVCVVIFEPDISFGCRLYLCIHLNFHFKLFI